MSHLPRAVTILAVAMSLLGLATPLHACAVPVFRYALDHWPADPYQLRTAPPQTLPATLAARLHALDTDLPVNVSLDPDATLKGRSAVLAFPSIPGGDVWSGDLDEKAMASLIDSPLRRQIARRLCQGDSGVWILIEGPDAAANDRLFALLNEQTTNFAKIAILPPRDVDDFRAQLGPGPELAVRFSVLRVKRNAADEAATITMLEGGADKAAAHAQQPIAALVFGRGHVLSTLGGDDLKADSITDACDFLAGSCSCEIKAQHPGWDLMMNFDWDTELQHADAQRRGPSTEPASVAPLTGTTRQSSLVPQTVVIQGQPTTQPAIPTAAHLNQAIWPILSIVAVFVTLAILLRSRKPTGARP